MADRTEVETGEARAWVRDTHPGTLIAAGAVIAASTAAVAVRVIAQTPSGDLWADSVLSIGALVAAATIYQRVCHWNMVGTATQQPGDRLNGVCAVLVLTGTGNLVAEALHGPVTGEAIVQRQLSLAVWSATFVVLGAILTVAKLARLTRDVRVWGFSFGAAALLGMESLAVAAPGDLWPWRPAVWFAAGVYALGLTRIRVPPPVGTGGASKESTTQGALTVLFFGLVTLIAQTAQTDRSWWVTAYVSIATLAISAHLLSVVKELELLALTRLEARTDELTGIANRRALTSAMEEALERHMLVSLLIIDLNRFKAINDRYGHTVGDELLQHVAGLFSGLVPANGLLARLGGDEFAVLLPGTGQRTAMDVATTLARAAAPVSDVRGRMLQFGASVGVAEGSAPATDGVELMRRADAAMYLAKGLGVGARCYDADLDAEAREAMLLAEELHHALSAAEAAEQIVVFFQPQLSATTGEVVGAEALVRWQHPRLGLVPPDRFLELAETNGLMGRLTLRVLSRATEEAARWHAAGRPLRVSVNLSASCLRQPELLPALERLVTHGPPAGELVLELTETTLMNDPDHALAAMHAIAALGIGLSIDDYGTGYSSLSYLNDLPATELKIDRSFTARVLDQPRTRAIVAGTVELAHRLGMRLVAEGVEDEATLAAMRDLGCDETQGYFHSRPVPADDFLDWLLAREARPVPRPRTHA